MVDKDFLNDFEEQVAIKKIVDLAFEGRKKTSNWQRNLITAAAMIIIGIPIFGYSFPALARHIPVIGGLFGQESIRFWGRLVSMEDYATRIGETQYADGVSITLIETYFDGRIVYVSYLLESEQRLDQSIRWFNYALAMDLRFYVDGTQVPMENDNRREFMPYIHWIDDYSFMFLLDFPVVMGESPILYEIVSNANEVRIVSNFSNFEIREDFWQNADKDLFAQNNISAGPWNFNLTIERSERIRIPVNETRYHGDIRMGIHDFNASPNRISFEYGNHVSWPSGAIPVGTDYIYAADWRNTGEINALYSFDYRVTDNFGNELTQSMRIQDHYTGLNSWGWIYFDIIDEGMTSVKIVPTITRWQFEDVSKYGSEFGILRKTEIIETIELDEFIVEIPN